MERAGVRDAGQWRVPGYPYLRLDRFTASFAADAAREPALFRAWLARARALDRDAREVEIGNLPPAALQALQAGSRQAVFDRTERGAALLEAQDFATAEARRRLIEASAVPSGYDQLGRAAGLYPLTRLLFAQGVRAWHADAEATFRHFDASALGADVVRYAPPPGPRLDPRRVAAWIARGSGDPLGIPRFDATQRAALFATYAPEFAIATAGDFDRPGAVRWGEAPTPGVDPSQPTVYQRLAYTRYANRVLPQLVYTLWFAARPGSSALDPLAGALDGIIFRVTLGADGLPLVYDSIHPCGCYHMFFPTARVRAEPPPRPLEEWAFSPATAPELRPGERVRVYIASGTHYLSGIAAASPAAPASGYRFADERALLALPLPGGGTRSLYGPEGLVAGTERAERFLFWPMGVPSAGTMREWGLHDTAFVGERHFDDPDLIERRFRPAAP